MSRRAFLELVSASLVTAACGAGRSGGGANPARGDRKIRAVAFDLFTLFDPRTVDRVAESIVPGHAKELCESWRVRQFEYCWIRASAGQYRDFHAVTEDALAHAAKALDLTLSADARAELVGAYERLDPWPDTKRVLESFKQAGLKLAPLANYTPAMIENLFRNGGMRAYFDEILSTDRVRSYKPSPRAYDMGPNLLRFGREEIAFAAFGGWDAAGARWYGYPTFWVNRLGLPAEELTPGPDATGATLDDLATWLLLRT